METVLRSLWPLTQRRLKPQQLPLFVAEFHARKGRPEADSEFRRKRHDEALTIVRGASAEWKRRLRGQAGVRAMVVDKRGELLRADGIGFSTPGGNRNSMERW